MTKQNNDNATCPSCGHYNAMLYGTCRDCGYTAERPVAAIKREPAHEDRGPGFTHHDGDSCKRTIEIMTLDTAGSVKQIASIPERRTGPICKYCGKALRRYRARSYTSGLGADGKAREWGDYGDNVFCGRTCGHLFAVAILARANETRKAEGR